MWVRVFIARPGIRYRCARFGQKGALGRQVASGRGALSGQRQRIWPIEPVFMGH